MFLIFKLILGNSRKSSKKDSEVPLRNSTGEDNMNSSETPNPLRDQTPSQLTNAKSPSPEEIKVEETKVEPKKPFKCRFPMSNQDLIEHYGERYLTRYEKKEILKFPTVYFFNILERKLNGGVDEPKGNILVNQL